MIPLQPDHYFDLQSFAHGELFECEFVWEALEQLQNFLRSAPLGECHGEVSSGAYLVRPELITIGPGTIVEPGAYIEGPCLIGAECQVRHGAYIRGGVMTGDRVVIGHATEVKNSILLNDAKAAHFAYLGDSILGAEVNLGAGTRLANLRLDGREIVVRHEGRLIATGRRKLGAIIGDGAQLGCNCVTNPGTLIGKEAVTYPCLNISGVIANNRIIKRIK